MSTLDLSQEAPYGLSTPQLDVDAHPPGAVQLIPQAPTQRRRVAIDTDARAPVARSSGNLGLKPSGIRTNVYVNLGPLLDLVEKSLKPLTEAIRVRDDLDMNASYFASTGSGHCVTSLCLANNERRRIRLRG
ncbi:MULTISPECIES: hypothetical protein [Streptomyces]